MAVGLTTIVTGVIEILFGWANSGEICKRNDQRAGGLRGLLKRRRPTLRSPAEQSMDDFMRRSEYFPVVLATLRLLDYAASYDPNSRDWLSRRRPTRQNG